MKIRKAEFSDSSMLLDWRNDKETRLSSINTAVITNEEHESWFRNNINDVYIAETNEPVGTIRLSGNELSWTIAPYKRLIGLGKEMVKAFLLLVDNRPLVAYIKQQNIASQKIAKEAGFELVEDGYLQKWIKSNEDNNSN